MKKLALTIICASLAGGALAQQADDGVRYNQYGIEVSRTPLQAEMRDGILVFESKDQAQKVWFDIRVQLDGSYYFGERDYMDKIGSGVTNRRTRFAVKSQLSKRWYGEVDTDFANGDFELKDALLRYSVCRWEITAGNFKEDFSMSQITTSRYLPFMERPMVVQAFAPSRHLGFDVKWGKDWFYGSVGMFFQTIDGAETRTWVEANNNNKGPGHNDNPSYTARLVFRPLYKHDHMGAHIGFGGSHRSAKIDAEVYEAVRYSTRNSTNVNRKKYLDTDDITNVHYQLLYNIELAGWYKGFRFESEYIWNDVHLRQDRVANTYLKEMDGNLKIKRFGGWYAQACFMLFGGQQSYNWNDSKFTQPTRGRSWGDIELLARYDYIDLNSQGVYGGSGQNFTVGVNYYINSSVKFVLNYQYSYNDRYANGKGTRFNVGVNRDGNPTNDWKLIAPGTDAGIKYQMLGLRLEIDF